MSKIPADLKYTRSHEWLKAMPDGIIEIGISDHAQHALGDLRHFGKVHPARFGKGDLQFARSLAQ